MATLGETMPPNAVSLLNWTSIGDPRLKCVFIDVSATHHHHEIALAAKIDLTVQQRGNGDRARWLRAQTMSFINPAHGVARFRIGQGDRPMNETFQDRPIMLADIIRQQAIANAGRTFHANSLLSQERLAEIVGGIRLHADDLGLGKSIMDGDGLTGHQSAAADLAKEMGNAASVAL